MAMTVLLIVLLIAVVAVYRRRAASPQLTPLLYVLIGLALAVVVMRIARQRPAGPDVELANMMTRATGYRLGQAIAEDIPDGTAVLVMHDGLHPDAARRRPTALVEGLEQGLGTAPFTVEVTDPDLDSEDADMLADPGLSPYLLRMELGRRSGIGAVVSLMGAPYFESFPARGAFPPIYVAVDDLDDILQPLLQRGIVRAAVRFREDADPDVRPTRAMDLGDAFDLQYRLLRGPAGRAD
jgi:hypothetical protein